MYRVALIDDVEDQYPKYKIRLSKKEIELVFMDFKPDYSEIVEWILDEKIEFVLIDYKLEQKYDFQGSQLMQYINNSIPDLQCVLFTSNTADDDLVMDNLKIDKNVFSSTGEEFNEFIETIKQAIKVFRNRKENTLKEYRKLQEKQKDEKLSVSEIEQMKNFYKILVSYGMVEKIPEEMLDTNIEEKIDKLIGEVEEYINQGKNKEN